MAQKPLRIRGLEGALPPAYGLPRDIWDQMKSAKEKARRMSLARLSS